MSISLEALAMSGTSYVDYGMDIDEWERLDLEIPPHLLAEEEEEEEEEDHRKLVQKSLSELMRAIIILLMILRRAIRKSLKASRAILVSTHI